jgi:pyridoxamine 5'-phosphate oxidase
MWVWNDGMSDATPEGPDLPRLSDLRVHYDLHVLLEAELDAAPLVQFMRWFADAHAADVVEPNAMVVATSPSAGQPSARTVLLKQADTRGFVFYSNHLSRKGGELTENPHASAVFPWYSLHRQVVVVGMVERVPRAEAAEYFASRPRGSQLGAWTSQQSAVVGSRAELDAAYAAVEERFAGRDVPIPDFWGGYCLRPVSVEFWQGRESRLHDRLRFVAISDVAPMDDPDAWRVERLSP